MVRTAIVGRAPWTTLLSLLAGGLLAGCGGRNAYAPPPPPDVKVAVPVVKSVTVYSEFTGNTEASEKVEIRAQVQGYLQTIQFQDGDLVKKGKLLFTIDPTIYEAKVEQAKADLESAKANVIRTQAIYERTVYLAQQKSAAQQDVETTRGDLEVAKASVLQAQGKLKEAQTNLDFTRIYAPIDGKISRRQVDIGNLVQPNSTLLTTIARYDPMYVYFTASEVQHLEYLKQHPKALTGPVAKQDNPVDVGLVTEQGFPHRGQIDFVENTLDPKSGTLTVRATLPNPPPYALQPGLYARVRVSMGTREGAILVPERALGEDQGGQFLLVVNQDNVVEHRPVKVGPKVGDQFVIESGLRAGERFIVEGLQKARPGSKVNPK
jgi:RND family efflux transporter MFP subunit